MPSMLRMVVNGQVETGHFFDCEHDQIPEETLASLKQEMKDAFHVVSGLTPEEVEKNSFFDLAPATTKGVCL